MGSDIAIRRALVVCVALTGLGGPRVLAGQSDTLEVAGATLRGWEQQARLAIFDRGGSFSGRVGERGILERFNESMDAEYDLDVISSTFSLSETYEWYRRDNGARYWGGSIDHLQLVQQADLRASLALGGSWSADVWFTHERSLRARRNLLWLGFSRRLAEGDTRAFLRGTLTAEKPEADIEAGFVWAPGSGELTVALAALDLFSDFIYQELEVDPRIADLALDYTSHPFTARVSLEVPLGPRFRGEAHALALTPTTLVVESQPRPGDGFVQDERYAYAGGLVEWVPSARSALGGFATWVRASLDRAPRPAIGPQDDSEPGDLDLAGFDLTERSWQVGLYTIHRFRSRIAVEAWLARVWRTEERVRTDTTLAPNVAYEDRTWVGRNSILYRAPSGFRADFGLDFTARAVDGATPVPTLQPLRRDNFRLRGNLGWHFDRRATFLVGANFDLDQFNFDGAHGRFMLFW